MPPPPLFVTDLDSVHPARLLDGLFQWTSTTTIAELMKIDLQFFAALTWAQFTVGVLIVLENFLDRKFPADTRVDKMTTLIANLPCLLGSTYFRANGATSLAKYFSSKVARLNIKTLSPAQARETLQRVIVQDEMQQEEVPAVAAPAPEPVPVPASEGWIVSPRLYQLFYKNKLRWMETKRMRIAPSQIPALVGKSNSWGVFIGEKVLAGDFIGVYWGVYEERKYAELLRAPEYLLASHMKDVQGKWTGHLLDGIINNARDMDWYASRTLIGSVFNCGFLDDNINTLEAVVPAGLLGFEHPHGRTGLPTRVCSLMCYFAKYDMDENQECFVNLGPDHRGSYFVPEVADRLVLPPYPPRPPIRVDQEYDQRSAQSIRDSLDSRQERFKSRYIRHEGEGYAEDIPDAPPSPAAAPIITAPVEDYARRTRAGAAGGVGAGAAPPPSPASADEGGNEEDVNAVAGLPGVGIAAVEQGPWVRRSSRPAPLERVRFIEDDALNVTIKRNREQYMGFIQERADKSSKSQAESLDDYIEDIITLQISEAAQNTEIEALRSVIHDALEGEMGGDVGWELSNLAEKSLQLARQEYRLKTAAARDTLNLQKTLDRRNQRIADLLQLGKRKTSVKLWRAQSTLKRVRMSAADLKAQEDEEEDVMIQVAKEAAARSSASDILISQCPIIFSQRPVLK